MNLRAVPERPPRAIAYVRVSDEGGRGEDLMSPDIQIRAIRDHCARSGYEVILVLEDIDRTGQLWKRRQIESAVKMIEAGQAEVIVVWKISRVSRNRLDWAIAVDRVEGVGGEMESALEPVDTKTAAGRFTRGMFAELAAFEGEVIGETWKSVHKERTDAGLPHYGPQRLGYTYDHATGYSINDDQAEIVRDLYSRYSAGEGLTTLTKWLRAEGVTGARGKPWSRYGVAYYLRSGFAAGLLYVHDPTCRCGKKGGACANRIHRPAAHTAIITPEQWAAYQHTNTARSTAPIRSRVPVSRLAGVVICAGCKRPMQLQASSGKPRHAYFCRTNNLTGEGCPAPGWVKRTDCEDAARAWLAGIAELVDQLLDKAGSKPVAAARKARLQRTIVEADTAMANLAVDRARRRIPESIFDQAVDELLEEQAAARAELDKLEGPKLDGITEAAAGLLDVWDTAAPHETAAVVRHLLRIMITRGAAPRVVGAWTV